MDLKKRKKYLTQALNNWFDDAEFNNIFLRNAACVIDTFLSYE